MLRDLGRSEGFLRCPVDARLDKPFESPGGFGKEPSLKEYVHGKVKYDPSEGIELELVQNLQRKEALSPTAPGQTIYGRLADGSPVTLIDCWVRKLSYQLGHGI